jgi:uncharacterized SAM-binding protein YcdF (DUF218 family)
MLLRVIGLVFGIWLGGFIGFSHTLATIPKQNRKTDAVIALTGGEGRVERAVFVLGHGKAKRLLISGVNRATTAQDLRRRTGASEKLFKCCVDIGHVAGNTIGNAVEAAVWMDNHGFKSLRLVTSRSHMPRARLEFVDAMPNIQIVPEAVDVENSVASRLFEYNKYAARLIFLRLKQL